MTLPRLMVLFWVAAAMFAQQNEVARTPPMGWNSWNLFACKVNDAVVRAQADAMASNGMKAAGYTYINIDDC
jgi:alpha-galactosidase